MTNDGHKADIHHGVPGTGVLDTGLDRSAAFCSSVISGSFFCKQHSVCNNNIQQLTIVPKNSQKGFHHMLSLITK